MVILRRKNWKPLEQIIKEKKIKEISLTILEQSDKRLVYRLEGDGTEIHTTHISNYSEPYEILRLKLQEKKGFPLKLTSIEINTGIVKVKFDKKN